MKNSIYISLEKHIYIDTEGCYTEESNHIDCRVCKSSNGMMEDYIHLEVGSSFDDVKKKGLDIPYKFFSKLYNEGHYDWIVDIIKIGEYDFAGKVIKVSLKDIILFCKEEHYISGFNKLWTIDTMKPYLTVLTNEEKYEDILLHLMKFTLDRDIEIEEIIEYFDSLLVK